MSIFGDAFAPKKNISTIVDVCELIDQEIGQLTKEIEKLAFSTSVEADKRRTGLVAQRDMLIRLKVVLQG
jgi:hypothetical protein